MATSTNLPDLRAEYPPHAPGRSDAERSSLPGLLPGIGGVDIHGAYFVVKETIELMRQILRGTDREILKSALKGNK